MHKRVLLGHLNSNGDCLFATAIARQIKEVDYLDCHLTWAVNSKCKQSILLNPYVDTIWEIPTEKAVTSIEEWNSFLSQVESKKKNGDFDVVFLTQIIGDNWLNFDGGIRSSVFNNYPHKITVSIQPVIQLSDAEVSNVKCFAEKHGLADYKRVILIECGPDSFDSSLNPQSALELALHITDENKEIAVILSSNKIIDSTLPNVIDASGLTFRENAELTRSCDLFIGCASGISWLSTTDWAKKLNTILVINQDTNPFPSMVYDHEYFDLPTDHIIEMKSAQGIVKKLSDCVDKIMSDGFAYARKAFHEKIRLRNFTYLDNQLRSTLSKGQARTAVSCLKKSIERNGIRMIARVHFQTVIWNLPIKAVSKLLKNLGLKKKERVDQTT